MLMRYLNIFRILFRTSLVAELEFRANIAWKIFSDCIWYFTQISVFEVLYLHTPQIAGWSLDMTRVFLGSLFLTDALNMTFFSQNLEQFSDRVRKGELDLILAKPLNSQFMMSFYRMQPSYLFNVLISLGWLVWAVQRATGSFGPEHVIKILLTSLSGITIMYSMRFMVASMAVTMGRGDAVHQMWYSIYRLCLRPDFVYPAWLRYLFFSVLPLGFIASVPAHVVLGLRSLEWLVGAMIMALIFLKMSSTFWSWILKNYSSASS